MKVILFKEIPELVKHIFFKEIFPEIFKNELKCVLINNQHYNYTYKEDSEDSYVVLSGDEKFPLIADCKTINKMCGKPVCIIFDEFENNIRKEEDILYMKELLDYIELNNLPIFFIFLSNDYKKIKDVSLYRSGRINNKINIDKYSTIPFLKLRPDDDIKDEIFEDEFIEKLSEYKKYKDNITISDFKRYNSFLSKLYNIENKEKRNRIIEFTFGSD